MRKAIIWFLFGDTLAIMLLLVSLKLHPHKHDEIKELTGASEGLIRR